MTDQPLTDHPACATCAPWIADHNAAIANGLISQARFIELRLAAHQRDIRDHAAALRSTPTQPDTGLREAAQAFYDMMEAESEHEGVLRVLLRAPEATALRAALATEPAPTLLDRIERTAKQIVDQAGVHWYLAGDVRRILSATEPAPTLDALDAARAEYRDCLEVRRLLGYLWNATGKNHLRPVRDLFAEDDPIAADIERLAIFDPETPR